MKSENQMIEDLKEYLGKYRSDNLSKKCGTYNYKRKSKPYEYILPKEMQEKNLINSDVMKKYPDVKRHSLFNHLTSSQALCLNLLGPLVADHLNLLNSLLGFDVKDHVRAEFEFVDDLIHDRSNFDFFIETKKHDRLYFEFKYTEGTIHTKCEAKDTDERWRRFYSKPMLTILEDKNSITSDVFCKQYQLWRNICRVANDHCEVYFVFPVFRKKLKRQVEEARLLLKPEFKNKVHVLTVDEICKIVLECGESKYKEHYNEFKKKYLPEKIYNKD